MDGDATGAERKESRNESEPADADPGPPTALMRPVVPDGEAPDDEVPDDEHIEAGSGPAAVPRVPPPAEETAHRRSPGLWFPLIVFVLLLVAGGAVGRFVVPPPGPMAGAAPAPAASTQPPSARPDPTLPPMPSLPVRPADTLADWAEKVGAAIGVPPVAVQAYGYAQLLLQDSDPTCHLAWTTLAGIAEVESFHGQTDGAVLRPSGRSDPLIIGPALDGRNGRALVRDTDAGAYDGDATYDRMMGPFRLAPTLWRAHASDADGDGVQDPYDIDDASLAVARLLCQESDDLSQLSGWTTALGRYRGGDAYARSVFDVADDYGRRTHGIG